MSDHAPCKLSFGFGRRLVIVIKIDLRQVPFDLIDKIFVAKPAQRLFSSIYKHPYRHSNYGAVIFQENLIGWL